MPVTSWHDIVGLACASCGKLASHYWGGRPTCCTCHGGYLCSPQETEEGQRQAYLDQ